MRSFSLLYGSILGGLFWGACGSWFGPPNYAEHIRPIMARSCVPCHQPNQVGHFSLLTYADARLNANKIKYTVSNRLMPPWPADPHYTEFAGELVLFDKDIETITRWVSAGCPPGDTALLKPIDVMPYRSFLGQPDMTLAVPPSYFDSGQADRFLLVKVPFELPSDTFLRAVEFVPGNTRLVHHVNGDMVRFDYENKKQVNDGIGIVPMALDSTIREAYHRVGVLHDDGSYPVLAKSVVNYLPGVVAQQYPDGIGGWKVNRKNAFLLADLHYGPAETSSTDSSYINLFFASKPPERPLKEFQMGTLGISPIVPPLVIPPNKISKYQTEWVVPETISVVTINPHMHWLGKSFKAFALTPKSDTIRLIHIPKWNFNWQFFYTFKKMVVLPAGSRIIVEGVFDNTSSNPFNPNYPPKIVSDKEGSMKSSDEMFQFIVNYVTYKPGDEAISLERK
jgi:hypothetical protein